MKSIKIVLMTLFWLVMRIFSHHGLYSILYFLSTDFLWLWLYPLYIFILADYRHFHLNARIISRICKRMVSSLISFKWDWTGQTDLFNGRPFRWTDIFSLSDMGIRYAAYRKRKLRPYWIDCMLDFSWFTKSFRAWNHVHCVNQIIMVSKIIDHISRRNFVPTDLPKNVMKQHFAPLAILSLLFLVK